MFQSTVPNISNNVIDYRKEIQEILTSTKNMNDFLKIMRNNLMIYGKKSRKNKVTAVMMNEKQF